MVISPEHGPILASHAKCQASGATGCGKSAPSAGSKSVGMPGWLVGVGVGVRLGLAVRVGLGVDVAVTVGLGVAVAGWTSTSRRGAFAAVLSRLPRENAVVFDVV